WRRGRVSTSDWNGRTRATQPREHYSLRLTQRVDLDLAEVAVRAAGVGLRHRALVGRPRLGDRALGEIDVAAQIGVEVRHGRVGLRLEQLQRLVVLLLVEQHAGEAVAGNGFQLVAAR